MADSRNTTNLSRRALMATSVGLVSAHVAAAAIAVRAAKAMAPAAPVDATADAELVELCRRWVHLHRIYIDTDRQAIDAEGVDQKAYERLNALSDSLYEQVKELTGEVAGISAGSWAGIAAKASTIQSALKLESGVIEDGHPVLDVVPGLVDDIARLTGGMPARAGVASVEV
jgi:hypothetical protein